MVTKAFVVQYGATWILALQNLSIGMFTVWPSYALRYFVEHPEVLGGTYLPHHSDLVGSLPMLGSFITTIVGGPLADMVGRKRGELISGVICLLAWALTCTAKTVNAIMAARLIVGLGCGLSMTMHNLFIIEYSEVKYRGTNMSVTVFAYTFGILISYVMGWLCSYDVVNYFMLSLSVMYVVGLCLLKETPAYLLKIGKDKDALDSLKFYRGTAHTSQDILDELTNIKNLIQSPNEMVNLPERYNHHIEDPEKEKLKQEVEEMFKPKPKPSCWKALRASKGSQRGLVISSLLIILLVFMGMIAVQTFAGQMFSEAVPSLSPDLCSVALAVANMLGCVVPLVLSEYLGRRALMNFSCVVVTACLFAISALLRWPVAPAWAVPALMLAYCFFFQLGIGCVPFVFLSECFAPEVNTVCTTIALCLMWVGNFIMLAVFFPMVSLIGMDGAFFSFAVIAAATTVISYLVLPETSGLGTEAIQALLGKGYLQTRRRKLLER